MANFRETFRPKSGALAFFVSILIWGIGVGSFAAVLNNFLHDIHGIDQQARGSLEFFREMPGVFLVVLLALMNRLSDWRIMRLGTLISMLGVTALCVPANYAMVTVFVVTWSLGEHLVMPIRSSIAMQVAQPGKEGVSLGVQSGVMNCGSVLGSLLVAVVFWGCNKWLQEWESRYYYDMVWGLIGILMLVSFICTFTKNAPKNVSKRPRLYFNWKYNKFYILELFYGARKQIFFTFAPFVLVSVYGFNPEKMALLHCLCCLLNILCGPMIGRLCDKWGYRNVMIYDTVVLFFVCLMYGFADKLFSHDVALVCICINYILDAILSQTSMASNLYVKAIGSSRDEITSTLSTGISINHVISIFAALAGGWVWKNWGLWVLFVFAAAMCVGNTLCAMTVPKPAAKQADNA